MYSAELITLPGKPTGNIAVHSIVELSLVEVLGNWMIQVVPAALVIEHRGEILSFCLEKNPQPNQQPAV